MIAEYRLTGKVALITGGGRGIGTGIAEVLAEAGCDVAVNALTAKHVVKFAEGLANRTGRRILPFIADVTRSDQVDALIRDVVKQYGRVDILVNNLGDAITKSLVPLPGERGGPVSDGEIRHVIDINLTSAILCTRAIGPHFLERRSGKVIMISSFSGIHGRPNLTLYSAGKSGLTGLTASLALEWAPYGIRANAITPGYIRTPGTEAMYADPEIYEGRRKGVPMGRVGSGEDIAGPAVFLACEESRYTTGSVLGADGGQAVGYFLTVPGRRFSGGRID